MDLVPGPLLQTVDSPEDLKKLNREQLQQLTDELRQYIIDVVSLHGGHFAASLGVAELTVVLTDGAPLAFAQIRAKTPPDRVERGACGQAFGLHALRDGH